MGGSASTFNPTAAGISQSDLESISKISGKTSISDLAKKYNLSWPLNLGSGTGAATPPAASFNWQFPQYSQTWAFTPPTPPPVNLPPAFNAATYGKDTKKGDDDKDGDGGGGSSRMRRGGNGIYPQPGSYFGY